MSETEKTVLCPCGSGRKFRKCHGAEPKRRGVPPWLFFVVLALLGAGALYYKNSVDSANSVAGVPLTPPAALPSLPALPATPVTGTLPPAVAATAAKQVQGRYESLPGFSLTDLTASQKQKFLDRVNSENCSCGCVGDTIAKCLVDDPACQVAPAMAKRILAEVQVAPR